MNPNLVDARTNGTLGRTYVTEKALGNPSDDRTEDCGPRPQRELSVQPLDNLKRSSRTSIVSPDFSYRSLSETPHASPKRASKTT